MVSRTHPGLLKRLFELEVPEIHDGLVEIKSVAREPGMRSKISVYTKDENIDPVGACVGHKGMRVQTIVNELRGEKSISSNTVPSLINMWLMPYRQLRLSVLKFWKKKKSAAL